VKYDKLVRDRIPEIIRDKGIIPVTHIASDGEYRQKLRLKLQEEVDEFLADDNTEELADILEVVYALGDLLGYDRYSLEQLRNEKASLRGQFKDGIILEETLE